MKIRNVLGLFDGISCGRLALERAGIKFDRYYSSEIDKYAIQISDKNYSDNIQLGDILNWRDWDLEDVDLVIGGSPCQGFSVVGKQLNFDDPRSRLFFVYLEIVKYFKPKYFLLENVVMDKEIQDIISNLLGVEPILINSSLVSAQNRRRLYWTNITNVTQPTDLGISLSDVLESNTDWSSAHIVSRRLGADGKRKDNDKSIESSKCVEVGKNPNKAYCLTTVNKDSVICKFTKGRHTDAYGANLNDWRNLTNVECERLQTLPDNYTTGVAESNRRRLIGNGWTVDVIAHIFKHMEVTA